MKTSAIASRCIQCRIRDMLMKCKPACESNTDETEVASDLRRLFLNSLFQNCCILVFQSLKINYLLTYFLPNIKFCKLNKKIKFLLELKFSKFINLVPILYSKNINIRYTINNKYIYINFFYICNFYFYFFFIKRLQTYRIFLIQYK